jgi:hypothetical protein
MTHHAMPQTTPVFSITPLPCDSDYYNKALHLAASLFSDALGRFRDFIIVSLVNSRQIGNHRWDITARQKLPLYLNPFQHQRTKLEEQIWSYAASARSSSYPLHFLKNKFLVLMTSYFANLGVSDPVALVAVAARSSLRLLEAQSDGVIAYRNYWTALSS